MSSRIVVIDYGMGNLHSVASALEHVAPEAEVIISADPVLVQSADRVVFPGVGAIRDCVAAIREQGVDRVVREVIESGKPLLAICVGMQALLSHSEENGGVECLNLVPGQVKFFGQGLKSPEGEHLKVPHMGWNQVHQVHKHPLWEGIAQDSRFYFVHSYFVAKDSVAADWSAATCHYSQDFVVALAHKNIFAVQFHPEKSHTAGLQLLRNFTRWSGHTESPQEK